MNPSVWPTAAVVVVGLALAWRFALAHAAVAAVSRARLRELADQGVGRADRLYLLLARRDAVQTALRLGYLGSLVVIAAAGWWLAHATPWPAAMGSGLLLATCLGAELWPRLLAAAQGEQAALRQARWVTTAYRLWGPLAGWLSADEPARDEPDDEGTAESFREMVDTAPLKATQRRRITEILDFPDRAAADIMVPRVDVVALPADASLPAAAELVSASGPSAWQASASQYQPNMHSAQTVRRWR